MYRVLRVDTTSCPGVVLLTWQLIVSGPKSCVTKSCQWYLCFEKVTYEKKGESVKQGRNVQSTDHLFFKSLLMALDNLIMDRRRPLGLVTSETRELWPTNEPSWSGKVQEQGCIWVTLIHGLYIGALHTFALNMGLFILKIMINFVTKS